MGKHQQGTLVSSFQFFQVFFFLEGVVLDGTQGLMMLGKHQPSHPSPRFGSFTGLHRQLRVLSLTAGLGVTAG